MRWFFSEKTPALETGVNLNASKNTSPFSRKETRIGRVGGESGMLTSTSRPLKPLQSGRQILDRVFNMQHAAMRRTLGGRGRMQQQRPHDHHVARPAFAN